MRIALLATAVALAAIAAPLASADAFVGNLSAQRIYIEGDTTLSSTSLVAQIGGSPHSFQVAPSLTLTADKAMLTYRNVKFANLDVNGYSSDVEDPTNPDKAGQRPYDDLRVTIESWLPEDSELVVIADPTQGAGEGRTTRAIAAPTPLRSLEEATRVRVGPPTEVQVGFGQDFGADLPAGSLQFTEQDFVQGLEYTGAFDLLLYGASYRADHAEGTQRYETGLRSEPGSGAMGVGTYWMNITLIRVLSGHLSLDPAGNPVDAFVPNLARIEGAGAVFLKDASGHLQDERQAGYDLEADSVNLVGEYDISVRGEATGTLLVGLQGDFDTALLSLFGGPVADARPSLWWVVAAFGVVVASGSGLLILRKNRSETPLVQPVRRARIAVPAPVPVAPAQPARIREPTATDLLEVADAAHMEPGFTWRDLSEDFGVVRAAEQAGLFIVLVPSRRVSSFLDAVVARGLMAEDTGDRVEDGKQELAVITLQPSPVMLN